MEIYTILRDVSTLEKFDCMGLEWDQGSILLISSPSDSDMQVCVTLVLNQDA